MNHRDSSVRRRALDVVSALVDEQNVETIIPEVLDYIKLADSEFRVELVTKIFSAVQRFAPNPKNFDTVHQLLIDSGNYIGSEIITSICLLILRTPSIQPHAVKQLSMSLMMYNDNQSLIQITSWVLGEFATNDDNSIENLQKLMILPQTTDFSKGYILIALAKLVFDLIFENKSAIFFQPMSNLEVWMFNSVQVNYLVF